MKKYEDYRVPEGLAAKLLKDYPNAVCFDEHEDHVCYEDTLDALAECILNDYDEKKMTKVFGCVLTDVEKMSEWLMYNVPDLYELLLIKNKEL